MSKPQDFTHNKTGRRLLVGLLMTTVLTACGYKGPLYMPPPPAPDESLTTPPASTSLPASEEPDRQSSEPSSATPSPVQ